MISPILSYNSEIWGVYVKHDFKAWDNTPIEKTHLKFCKRYLEISNKASNVARRSELGRFPLIINIYKNILYYILYLLRKNEDTIVKQAFRTSLELHCNGKNSFYNNLMKISEYYDLPDFDPNNLSEAKIKHYIDIIKQKYIAYWQHTIHHSKKLQFYSLFKHDYKISSYLDLIRNSANRKDLVKIRISNHKLMIETGRYNQTSRNDRLCPICNSGIIEDEFHFLFHCPKYSIPREKFYNQIQQNFVDFNQLSYTELIIKLMNSQNFSVNSHLLKFVSLCNDLRNNLLSNHADDT